jgi:hypothetical protein
MQARSDPGLPRISTVEEISLPRLLNQCERVFNEATACGIQAVLSRQG